MSITLTTPYQVSVNNVSVENDTVGACTCMSMDFLANVMTYTFKIGTLTGSPSNLNVGSYAQTNGQIVTVSVYVGPTTATQTFGQWYLNGVLQSTIVAAATLNPIVTKLISDRNTAEGFVAVAGGLMPGTVVAWAAL